MDANLKREKPADMLRVEAAYCGDEIVGLRITADDPARQLLVWADNSVMNGFRIGNEFIAGWDKKIEYRDVVIGEPEPAAPAAAIAAPTAQVAPAAGPDLQPLHNLLYLAQRQNSLGAMRCAITEARLELAKVRDEQKH